MRWIDKAADALLGRLAPKAKAAAACTGPDETWCDEHGVKWLFTPCPTPRTRVVGTC